LRVEWLAYKASGELPARRANRDPNHCPHGVYPAQPSEDSDDEWLAIAVTGDDEWQALAGLIDDDLADDPRFATHASRKQNEDELDGVIAAWTGPPDKWALAEAIQAVGVAAAPVEHLADTYDRDPQPRDHYQIVHQPVRPDIDVPIESEPARWVGTEHRLRRSPGVGEHNHEIVCGILGRSDEEFAQLLIDGVLG